MSQEWFQKITLPDVKIKPGRQDAAGNIVMGYFQVSVSFVDPKYPDLEYNTEEDSIAVLENSQANLMVKLKDRVEKWMSDHDLIEEKQALVDAALATITWGVV